MKFKLKKNPYKTILTFELDDTEMIYYSITKQTLNQQCLYEIEKLLVIFQQLMKLKMI